MDFLVTGLEISWACVSLFLLAGLKTLAQNLTGEFFDIC